MCAEWRACGCVALSDFGSKVMRAAVGTSSRNNSRPKIPGILVGNGIHEAAATTSKATSKILTGERGRCTTSTTTAIIRGRSHGPLTDTRRLGGGDR